MERKCIICGLPESEHHEFRSKDKPPDCQCDDGSWDDEIPAICDNFDNGGNDDGNPYCKRCEHDRACHKE